MAVVMQINLKEASDDVQGTTKAACYQWLVTKIARAIAMTWK